MRVRLPTRPSGGIDGHHRDTQDLRPEHRGGGDRPHRGPVLLRAHQVRRPSPVSTSTRSSSRMLTADERETLLDVLKSALIMSLNLSETKDLEEKRDMLNKATDRLLAKLGVNLNPMSKERIMYYLAPGLHRLRRHQRHDDRPQHRGLLLRWCGHPSVHLPP